MKKESFLFLVYFICFNFNSIGQKRIAIDATLAANFSFSNDIIKQHVSSDVVNPYTLYWTRKGNTNPFFKGLANFNYPVTQKLFVGLQSGVQFYIKEVHFIGIKRTFVAIPLQVNIDCEEPISEERSAGISIAGGGLFYHVNDYVYKINNALLFNASIFCKINKKQKIKFGVEKQIDNASFYYGVNNPNSKEVFKFSINRLSLFLAYNVKIL